MLAVQNMKAVGAVGKDQGQDVEFAALEGSLSMMSKGLVYSSIIWRKLIGLLILWGIVLNDVLDLYASPLFYSLRLIFLQQSNGLRPLRKRVNALFFPYRHEVGSPN